MPRGSSKPCPGCGGTEGYRPSTEVCTDCRHAIAEGKRLIAENEARMKVPERIVLELEVVSHWMTYLRYGRSSQEAFHALATELGEHMGHTDRKTWQTVGVRPGKQEALIPGSNADSSAAASRSYSKVVAELLRRLWSAIESDLAAAHKEGERDGSNLLSKIATGQVSVEDMNQAAREGRLS